MPPDGPLVAVELHVFIRIRACLIILHMSAEDEICGVAFYGTEPQGLALAWAVKDAHHDMRELIGETSLQPAGSPLRSRLAIATLVAWTRHCDEEEHGPAAGWRRWADPGLRLRWAASGGPSGRRGSATCIRHAATGCYMPAPHGPPGYPSAGRPGIRPAGLHLPRLHPAPRSAPMAGLTAPATGRAPTSCGRGTKRI